MTRVDKPALLRRLFELGCRYSGQILSYTKMLGQLQDADALRRADVEDLATDRGRVHQPAERADGVRDVAEGASLRPVAVHLERVAGKRPIDDKMKQRLDRVTKDEEELLLHFFASQQ